MPKSLQKKQDEEDEDHIDWASSEDEEIVKQEIETFERNQVMIILNFLALINMFSFFFSYYITDEIFLSYLILKKLIKCKLFLIKKKNTNYFCLNHMIYH